VTCNSNVVFLLSFIMYLIRYCFREASSARDFQRSRPNLSKIIEFQARVGYVKKISARIVSGKQDSDSPLADSPKTPHRRTAHGPTAMELIYNYSHYMYGALWVDDESVNGEKGTVSCTTCEPSASLIIAAGVFARTERGHSS
jgi:hypothetical protein